MATARITLVRSVIGRPQTQRATIKSLGLRKIGSSQTVELNETMQGQLRKVRHLLNIEELES